MSEKKNVVIPALFVAGIVFVSGFMNSYAQILYGGTVSFHSGNVFRLGYNLADQNYSGALRVFTSIICFMLGVMVSETVKKSVKDNWLVVCLWLEACILLATSFLPESMADVAYFIIVGALGIQINLVSKWNELSLNTNVSTGNLKTLAALLFKNLFGSDKNLAVLFGAFCIIFSMSLGSFVGAKLTWMFAKKTVWIVSAILVCWSMWYKSFSKR